MNLRARVCVALVVSILLAGCGGGGGGNSGGGGGTPPTPSPQSVQVHVTVTGGAPVQIAAQVAGGAWTRLTLSGSSASFSVPSSTSQYAIAVLCPTANGIQFESILEYTAADTVTPATACANPATVPLTVNFNVSAIAGAQEAEVALGTTMSEYWSPAVSAANISAVTPGVQDVGVAAYASPPTSSPLGVQIERGVNVTGAPITVPPMATTDATGSAPITVNSVPAGYTDTIQADYVTAGGTAIGINGNNASQYALIAAADTMSGDYYSIQASALNAAFTNQVVAATSFSTPQSATLTMPAPLSYAGPTPNAYPTFVVPYSGFTISGKTGLGADLSWKVGGVQNVTLIFASAAFMGSTQQVVVPNLSSVPGFFAPPPSATTVAWGAIVFSQTVPYEAFVLPFAPNNENAQYAVATGTYAEP